MPVDKRTRCTADAFFLLEPSRDLWKRHVRIPPPAFALAAVPTASPRSHGRAPQASRSAKSRFRWAKGGDAVDPSLRDPGSSHAPKYDHAPRTILFPPDS